LDVGEDNIDVSMSCPHQRDGIFSSAGFDHLPPGIAQRLGNHVPHQPLVLDDEDYP
jgi:hypothetical protein